MSHAFSTSGGELSSGRTDEDDGKVVESSLVRWINMTLGWSETREAITDLRRSLADGLVYGRLLGSLFPEHLDGESFADLSSDSERAQAVVEAGKKILGPRCILEVEDILRANETMNTLFLASICRLIAEEAGSVAPVSRNSSVASLASMHEEVEAGLKECITELERENENLRRRLDGVTLSKEAMVDAAVQVGDQSDVQFGAERVMTASGVGHVGATHQAVSDDDDVPTMSIAPHPPAGRSLRKGSCAASERAPSASSTASNPLGTLLQDSVRLRRIYEQSKDLKCLLKAIYEGDLSAYRLAESATLTGTLTKRGGWGMRWNSRFAVIKDNFMLFYRDATSSQPKEVERLDDCLVKMVEGVTSVRGEECPVLSVEVSSKVNPHYFYVSADAESLKFWRTAISKTSTWWSMKRFE